MVKNWKLIKMNAHTHFSLWNSHSLSSGISYSEAEVNSDASQPLAPSIFTCGRKGTIDPRAPGSLLTSEYRTLLCITTTRFFNGFTCEKSGTVLQQRKMINMMKPRMMRHVMITPTAIMTTVWRFSVCTAATSGRSETSHLVRVLIEVQCYIYSICLPEN